MTLSTAAVTSYQQTFALAAPPSRVFAALIEPAQLKQWFAEHAIIDPRVGGKFQFWGRHTPWVRSESEASQTVTAIERDRDLAFRWPWGGSDGLVSLSLLPDGRDTTLNLKHDVRGRILTFEANEIPWVLKDFWTLSMGNLREYLATGAPAVRPDFSKPGGDVIMSIVIHAPASAVWNALTDPKELDQWVSEQARVQLARGGAYSYGWFMADGVTPIGPSRLLEIEPGRRIVHDWSYSRDNTSKTEWTVDVITAESSRLTVRQIGTIDERESGGYACGWGRFLLRAKALLEGLPLF